MTDEQLTDEERGIIPTRGDTPIGLAVAKLLRIHDRLRARVEGMAAAYAEQGVQTAAVIQDLAKAEERISDLEARSPIVHLDRIPSPEERLVLRDLLMPHDLLQNDPAKMPTVSGAPVGHVEDQSFSGTCPTCGQRYHPPG
jgi:hypothetical protein